MNPTDQNLRQTHLVLFFTRGVSLHAWEANGSLEREVALYRALLPHLGRITFVTYGDKRDLSYRGRLGGIEVVCNRWGMPRTWYERYLTTVWPRLVKSGTMVVKTNQMPGAAIACAAAQALDAPFIARCGYLHSFNVEQREGFESKAALCARAEEATAFRGASAAVVTTQRIRDMVSERYHLAPKDILVVPNYVDTHKFCPKTAAPEPLNRIIYVGRLEGEKNPLKIIEGAAGLDAELVFVGSGPQADDALDLAKELGVRLQLLGNVPNNELPDLIRSGSIFALASNYEGHPKALTEAMACGIAVVGTDVVGTRDVIVHEHNGLLCQQDTASIHAAFKRLIDDARLRRQLGEQACADINRDFSLEGVLSKELAVIGAVARGGIPSNDILAGGEEH